MRRTVKPIPPGANIEPVMGLTPMSYDCLAVIVNYTNTHYSPCLLQVGPVTCRSTVSARASGRRVERQTRTTSRVVWHVSEMTNSVSSAWGGGKTVLGSVRSVRVAWPDYTLGEVMSQNRWSR